MGGRGFSVGTNLASVGGRVMESGVQGSLQEMEEQGRRLESMLAAALEVHDSLEPREALQRVVAEAMRLTRASSASLVLRNPNSSLLEIEAAAGLPVSAAVLRLPLGRGITGWVALHGQPARVGNVREDPRYVRVRPEVNSELAVPLLLDGEVRGVLNVDSEAENAFTARDEEVLAHLARHAVIVVRNTWQFEQARRKTELSKAVARMARSANTATALEEVLDLVTREAVALMGAKLASILMVTDDQENLEVRASHGAGPGYLGRGRLRLDDSLVGVVLRRRRPLQIEDVRSSRLYQSTEVARREGLVSLLSVPLLVGGEPAGVLNVYSGDPHTYSNEEIETLSALADLSAVAVERTRLAARMAKAEEELRQSDKLCALGLLAAEVAHEIRNPLTVMKMLYHSLDLRFGEGDPRNEDTRVIGEKMDLLNRIVEQILDFARNAEPRLDAVSLPAILGDLQVLVRPRMRAQGVEWALEVDPSTPSIRADAAQLEQALLNLVQNAVEAMPGGGRLTVRCRLAEDEGLVGATGAATGRQILVSVEDTGVGMAVPPKGGRGRLLGSTKPRGSGLGLAVVTRVIESHRGSIRFLSEPGKGTRVEIRLPVDTA